MHRRDFLLTAGVCAVGAAAAVGIPALTDFASRRAVVAPTFDTYLSTFTHAFPIMRERKLVGTFFVDPFELGKPGTPTLDMLVEMKAAGWEIGAYSARNMPELERKGYLKAYKHLREIKAAMEQFGFNVKSLAAMQRDWSVPLRNLARNVFENVRVANIQDWRDDPIADRLYVSNGGTVSLSAKDTGDTLCRTLEELSVTRRVWFPVVHQVGVDEDPLYSVPVDAFTAFCNCAERRIASGELRNMTFADAVSANQIS